MEKHELNFFPEAGDEDQKVLREDIQNCGFDKRFPILTFEGKILDGWNRFKASEKAGVKPVFEEFTGTHKEALEYSIRANLPRRNLSSSQRAAMAVKSSEIWDKISLETEKNKKEKISNSMIGNDNASKNQLGKKVSQTDLSGDENSKTATKIAKEFNTNQQYVKIAKKLKKEAPEEFEEVLSGKKKLSSAKKQTVKVERVKVDTPKVEKFPKKEGNQPYHWGDGKKVLTTAYKQLKECKRVLSNIAFSAPYQFSKFLDGKYTGFMDDLQSWIELSETCPICQGTGHRESGGHELDCEHCGNTGKVGRT